jgi:hypothetical protein
MYALCGQIVEEKDSVKFLKLVNELNDLLDRKEKRLECGSAPGQDS